LKSKSLRSTEYSDIEVGEGVSYFYGKPTAGQGVPYSYTRKDMRMEFLHSSKAGSCDSPLVSQIVGKIAEDNGVVLENRTRVGLKAYVAFSV